MSFYFMEWIVTNLARTVAPDNYDLGRQNWLQGLAVLRQADAGLPGYLQKQIAVVATGLAEGWIDADTYLCD